jgi:hypothetical protein
MEAIFVVPFLSFAMAANVMRERDDKRAEWFSRIKMSLVTTLPSVIVLVVLTVIRFLYFGEFLPNTFATKSSQSLRDFSQFIDLIQFNGLVFIKFSIVSLLAILGAEKRFRSKLLINFIPLCFIAFFVYAPSNLQMNYLNRFPYQIFWAIILVSILCTNYSPKIVTLYKIAVVMIIWIIPISNGSNLNLRNLDEYNWWLGYYPRLTYSYGELGKSIEAIKSVPKSEVKLVIGDIGLASFVNDAHTLDIAFKATKPAKGMSGIAAEIGESKSGVLAFFTESKTQDYVGDYQNTILKIARDKGWILVGSICWQKTLWLQIWASPDLTSDQAFMSKIGEAILISESENNRFRPLDLDIKELYWHY